MTRIAAALLALALFAAPAAAQSPPPPPPSPETALREAREALDLLMRSLGAALERLPQYGAPRLNERGDIVIPRLNPRSAKPQPPAEDETKT